MNPDRTIPRLTKTFKPPTPTHSLRWAAMVKFLSSKEGMGKVVTKMFRDLDVDSTGDVDIEEFGALGSLSVN